MKTYKAIIVSAGLALCSTSYADSLGITAGVGVWSSDYSGNVSKGTDNINLNSDLGLSNDNQKNYYIAFEHPIPLLPNFKLQRIDNDTSATNTINRSFNYGGQDFNVSDQVTTNMDLGYFDYIAYYQILDNWISLDIGIDVKQFDGSVTIRNSTQTVTDNLNDFIPTAYARAQFEIPATGVTLDVEASGLAFNGDSFSDIKVGVAYESKLGLGAELGYRRINLKVDNLSDINADITFDGLFANVTYHF